MQRELSDWVFWLFTHLLNRSSIWPVLIKYDGKLHSNISIELFQFSGGKNTNLNFNFGPKTDAYNGCSASLNGEMYVFGGGGTNANQVSSHK